MQVVGGIVPVGGVRMAVAGPAVVMAVAVIGPLRGKGVMVDVFGGCETRQVMRCCVAERRQQKGDRHRQGDHEGEGPAALPVLHDE